jgi:hypothetical protein
LFRPYKIKKMYPMLALDPYNIQILCNKCNEEKGWRSQKSYL